MSQLNTYPRQVEQGSVEDLTWGIDFTNQLVSPQTPTEVTVTLTSPNGVPVTLEDTAYVNGNVVQQRIRPGVLTGGSLYQLAATMTPNGTTNILAAILQIYCPQ